MLVVDEPSFIEYKRFKMGFVQLGVGLIYTYFVDMKTQYVSARPLA